MKDAIQTRITREIKRNSSFRGIDQFGSAMR